MGTNERVIVFLRHSLPFPYTNMLKFQTEENCNICRQIETYQNEKMINSIEAVCKEYHSSTEVCRHLTELHDEEWDVTRETNPGYDLCYAVGICRDDRNSKEEL